MQREKSNLRQDVENRKRRDSQKSISSTFNPPLSARTKTPLPAIGSEHRVVPKQPVPFPFASDVPVLNYYENEDTDLALPTKIFQAEKVSVKNLSQGLCSYLWFRRIKEIFLVMGKQNDAFTRFDMELARIDMLQTCDQYLENERPRLGGMKLVCRETLLIAGMMSICSFV